MTKTLTPLHPGEVLREEYLKPLGMSAGALARVCGVPRTRIERITTGEIGVTADTALRLAKALGTSAELWLNLQNAFDMQTARRQISKDLAKIGRVPAAADELNPHREGMRCRFQRPSTERLGGKLPRRRPCPATTRITRNRRSFE